MTNVDWFDEDVRLEKLKIKEEVFHRDYFQCFYCKRDLYLCYMDDGECFPHSMTCDHIVENKHGGLYAPNNLVACCPACNIKRERLKMTAQEFLIWRYEPKNRRQN